MSVNFTIINIGTCSVGIYIIKLNIFFGLKFATKPCKTYIQFRRHVMRAAFKKSFFLLTMFILLSGPVHALVISESIYVNVASSSFSEISVGTEIHLFDVTYDNAGTSASEYWNDGTLYQTLTADTNYAFVSEASFTLSQTVLDLVTSHGGAADFYRTYLDRVLYVTSDLRTQYHTQRSDYRLILNVYDDLRSDYGSLYVIDSGGGYKDLRFNSSRTVAGVAAPVPEPSTFLLLGGGLIGLTWYGRKRKQA